MDKLTIPPLWASLILMGLRYGLVTLGVATAETAAGRAADLYGALLIIAGVLWAIWAKLRSHAQKKALGAAAPSAVAAANPAVGGVTLNSLAPLALFAVCGLLLAASLAACGTLPAGPLPAAQAPDPVRLRIRQASAELDIAQHALLVARDRADTAGLLTGSTRAEVFRLTRRGGPVDDAVKAVRTADAALGADTLEEQVRAAWFALDIARALVPGLTPKP